VKRVLSVEELTGDNEPAMSQYLKRKYRQFSHEWIISRSQYLKRKYRQSSHEWIISRSILIINAIFIQLRGMQKNFQQIGKFMMFRVKSEIYICIYIGIVITS